MILGFGLALTAANVIFFYLQYKKPHHKQYTVDAQMLLKELASGQALLKIQIIEKDAIFLRSPVK